MKKLITALTCFTALTSLATASATDSQAQPRTPYQQAMVSYAMKAHHLDDRSAVAYLAQQSAEQKKLTSLEHAGVHIDGAYLDAHNRMTVVVNNDHDAAVAKAHGLLVRRGPGETALDRRVSELSQRFAGRKEVTSIRADLPTQTVHVALSTSASTTLRNEVHAQGKDIVITTSPAVAMQADVNAGQDMNEPSPAGWRRMCTTGFLAKLQSGKTVMLTAGHCVPDATLPINNATGVHIGTILDQRPIVNNISYDMGLIGIDTDDTPRGYVDTRGAAGFIPVSGMSKNAVGTQLCKSGRTTGWTCGVIKSYGATITYSKGVTVTGVTTTSVCTESGDSGGPFIGVGNMAQGVLSGGADADCGDFNSGYTHAGESESYIVPIVDLARYYGATLILGQSN